MRRLRYGRRRALPPIVLSIRAVAFFKRLSMLRTTFGLTLSRLIRSTLAFTGADVVSHGSKYAFSVPFPACPEMPCGPEICGSRDDVKDLISVCNVHSNILSQDTSKAEVDTRNDAHEERVGVFLIPPTEQVSFTAMPAVEQIDRCRSRYDPRKVQKRPDDVV